MAKADLRIMEKTDQEVEKADPCPLQRVAKTDQRKTQADNFVQRVANADQRVDDLGDAMVTKAAKDDQRVAKKDQRVEIMEETLLTQADQIVAKADTDKDDQRVT